MRKIVLFTLMGDMALWRNYHESMGSFSTLGPSPSNLAGLLGAALGFAAPHSAGAESRDKKFFTALKKQGLIWPVSPELLSWQKDNNLELACQWQGGFPKRGAWNVNGIKSAKEIENLRMQQQLIFSPKYLVAARLPEVEAEKVALALKNPAFPLSLGSSSCRAIVKDIRVVDELPESTMWAFRCSVSLGETTPFSRHVVNDIATSERIMSDGFWLYPTSSEEGKKTDEPFVQSWMELCVE